MIDERGPVLVREALAEAVDLLMEVWNPDGVLSTEDELDGPVCADALVGPVCRGTRLLDLLKGLDLVLVELTDGYGALAAAADDGPAAVPESDVAGAIAHQTSPVVTLHSTSV